MTSHTILLRTFLLGLGLVGICMTTTSCRDPGTLELIWSIRNGLVGQWGTLEEEVFTVGRYLGVYSLSTGRELRRVRLPQDYANITLGQIGPEVAITDSSLVFGWYDFGRAEGKQGKIFCYDPKTLALRWDRAFDWPWDVRETLPTFSVVIHGAHVYMLAIGKEGENLFKLQLSDGETVWSSRIEKYVQGVRLMLYGGKLLVRSRVSPWARDPYGHYQAINSETGQTLWRVRIDGTSGASDEQPLISGDRAYLTSEASSPYEYHLYAIDLRGGTLVDHQLVHRFHKPFAEHLGILYLGGTSPGAFHIGPRKIIWQTDLRGPQGLGPNIVARGVLDSIHEEIYLGDWERDLYVLSSTTGAVKEKVNIRGYWRGEFSSPLKAFFGSYGVERLELVQGLLFVGTVDKSLFVFRRR